MTELTLGGEIIRTLGLATLAAGAVVCFAVPVGTTDATGRVNCGRTFASEGGPICGRMVSDRLAGSLGLMVGGGLASVAAVTLLKERTPRQD